MEWKWKIEIARDVVIFSDNKNKETEDDIKLKKENIIENCDKMNEETIQNDREDNANYCEIQETEIQSNKQITLDLKLTEQKKE